VKLGFIALKGECKLKVCDKVMTSMFESKREKVTGNWKKLHTEKLNNLYSSQNGIRVTKPKRMSWARYIHGENQHRWKYILKFLLTTCKGSFICYGVTYRGQFVFSVM
jgi:hypothetical protein